MQWENSTDVKGWQVVQHYVISGRFLLLPLDGGKCDTPLSHGASATIRNRTGHNHIQPIENKENMQNRQEARPGAS
jgi:hypothetical protein